MNDRTEQNEIICFIISMVDCLGGEVIFNASHIRRVYNNSDDFVIIELVDDKSFFLWEMDFDILQSEINEWKNNHLREYCCVIDFMNGVCNNSK